MGKLLDSLLSGSSGRVGRVVVANVYGNELLRARPRRKTGAPTAKQVLVQQRMKLCYDFMLPYKAFAKEYFGTRVGMKSPYNLAMTNLLNSFQLDFILMDITRLYSQIEFARGGLLSAIPSGLTSAVPQTFTLNWFQNSGGDPIRENDRLALLFVGEDEIRPVFMQNAAVRLDGTVEIPVTPNLQGKTVHVWMAFQSDDLLDVSLSVYAGSILIT